MIGKGKSVDTRQETPSQRDSILPSSSVGSSEDQHWHSVNQNNCQVRYRDRKGILQGFRSLQPHHVILLLTPVVPPRPDTPDNEIEHDPYEYLGRALLARHSRGTRLHRRCVGEDLRSGNERKGPDDESEGELSEILNSQQQKGQGSVAHISYTNRNLLTSTHVGLMRLANFVILVVNNNSEETHPHVHFAQMAYVVDDDQTQGERGITLVLTNNSLGAFDRFEASSTIIQTEDYSKRSLDAITGIIFGEITSGTVSSKPGSPTG